MNNRKALGALCGLALLAACATFPTGAPTAPMGTATIPSTPLDLGDWRRASANAAAQSFEREITSRYGAGLALGAVSADLRRSDFACAAPRATDGRGDPPDQICRKTVSLEGCTHTWQVHLFDGAAPGRLDRTRALYDRRCGGDGLLGGPG